MGLCGMGERMEDRGGGRGGLLDFDRTATHRNVAAGARPSSGPPAARILR